MPEYVDKNELRRSAVLCEIDGKLMRAVPVATIQTTIAADVAQVIHGRWKYKRDGIVACSACGDEEAEQTDSNYCSNCGAKMDLKE